MNYRGTHSSKFCANRSSPSSSSSSSASTSSTASRSSRPSSVSENGAGGDDGGRSDDCESRRRGVGPGIGDDGATGDLARLFLRGVG